MFELLTFLFRLPIAIVTAPIGIVLYLALGLVIWVGSLLGYPGLLIAFIITGKKDDAKAAFITFLSLSIIPFGSDRARHSSDLDWILDFTPQGWLLDGLEFLGELWDWLTESFE